MVKSAVSVREQCEKSLAIIAPHVSNLTSFSQINLTMVDQYLKADYPILHKRCTFVVQEMERVKKAGICLMNNDFKKLGKLLFETYESLNNDHEMNCDELNFLVEQVRSNSNVLGAKMMGGGFGGCTLDLLTKKHEEQVVEEVKKALFRSI